MDLSSIIGRGQAYVSGEKIDSKDAEKATETLNSPSQESPAEALDSLATIVRHSLPLADNARNYSAIAKKAADQISELRSLQYEYAKEADSISDRERQASLQSEFDTIQTEIERIASSAEYNGVSVFSPGRTNSVISDDRGVYEAVGSPDLSHLQSSSDAILVGDQASEAAEETAELMLHAARITQASVAASYNKAESIVEGTIETKSMSLEKPPKQMTFDEAREVAVSVVQQLVSQIAGSNSQDDILFNSLDPLRVKTLLSDD